MAHANLSTSSDSGSATPSPPKRPILSTAERLEQYESAFNDHHVKSDDEDEPHTAPAPQNTPVVEPSLTASADNPPPQPAKKQKRGTKAQAATATDKVTPPTRRSPRGNKNKDEAEEATEETESPLAHKSKAAAAPAINAGEATQGAAPNSDESLLPTTRSVTRKRAANDAVGKLENSPEKKTKLSAVKSAADDAVGKLESSPPKKLKLSAAKSQAGRKHDDGKATETVTPAGPSKSTIGSKLPKTPKPAPKLKAGDDGAVDESIKAGDGDDGEEEVDHKPAQQEKIITKVVPDDYKGFGTGEGTTSNAPIGATLDQPWPCAVRSCNTGMTWYQREGKNSQGFGRPAISQFFGRNKGATALIDNDVWHTYCRKDYQRAFYRETKQKVDGKNPTPAQESRCAADFHLKNLRIQFTRLKLWRPKATFKIQLTKNMLARSHAWEAAVRAHPGDLAQAQAQYDKETKFRIKKPDGKLTPEEAFPLALVDTFLHDYCEDDADYDRCLEILNEIQERLTNGTLAQSPPVEFLISKPGDGEVVVDPSTNYARWLAYEDGRVFGATSSAPQDDVKDDDDDDNDDDAGDDGAGGGAGPDGDDAAADTDDSSSDGADGGDMQPPAKKMKGNAPPTYTGKGKGTDWSGVPGKGKGVDRSAVSGKDNGIDASAVSGSIENSTNAKKRKRAPHKHSDLDILLSEGKGIFPFKIPLPERSDPESYAEGENGDDDDYDDDDNEDEDSDEGAAALLPPPPLQQLQQVPPPSPPKQTLQPGQLPLYQPPPRPIMGRPPGNLIHYQRASALKKVAATGEPAPNPAPSNPAPSNPTPSNPPPSNPPPSNPPPIERSGFKIKLKGGGAQGVRAASAPPQVEASAGVKRSRHEDGDEGEDGGAGGVGGLGKKVKR